MQVWLAFTMQALVDPALRELRDTAHAELRDTAHAELRRLCRRAVDPRRAAGAAAAEQLHVFVDGLALHAVLAPSVTTPQRQVELLDAQLAGEGRPPRARPSRR
jgi:transcriptional regulator BetI-like protein